MSTSILSVRLVWSIALALRTMVPVIGWVGSESRVTETFAPFSILSAYTSGTATKMRNCCIAAMWKSSRGAIAEALPEPAVIRSPMSVLRAVITPSKGAVTCS